MARFDGKVVLISGAARGQGAVEAEMFVREGARVIAGDVLEEEGRALFARLGETARFVRLDVTDEASWRAAVTEAVERFGRLDVLVNNAGVYRPQTLAETTGEIWNQHYRVNQLGPFLGMRATLPALKKTQGTFVNVASLAALAGLPGIFAYTASKWALRGMSKSAAAELTPLGIRVNSVMPGLIDTPMIAGNPPELLARIRSDIPMRRMGRPEEVARLVLFLASDEASFISGAEITVDGATSA